jgi:hypothetical protein
MTYFANGRWTRHRSVSASVGMTRDQQILEALELLAPPATEREECRHEIRLAL